MKPHQVALLVIVSAVAGGLFMKWEIGRNAPHAVAAAPAVTPAAPVQPATPAKAPLVAQRPQPVEPEKPLPVAVNKKPHEVPKSHRAEPVTIARNEEPPAAQPAPATVTAPAVVVPSVVPPSPDAAPVQPAYPEPPQPVAKPEVEPAIASAPAPVQVTLKAGMMVAARMGQGLSSARNSAGDGFAATLDQPLVADGWVIAERGSRLEGKIVEVSKEKGQPELVLALTHVRTSDGQRVAIETDTISRRGQMAAGETAGKVAVGAIIGAAIGAIAGGGKGAAIGAGAGTAAGGGIAMATRSHPAVVPAESLIRFRLKTPVTITERQGHTP